MLLVLWFLGVMLFPGNSLAENQTEYQVKAAFLYRFVQFTEWPQEAFEGPDDPIRVCVFGGNPFGSMLERMFAGKVVKKRRFEVFPDVSVSYLRNCHVAYIGSSESLRTNAVKWTLQNGYALTVGGDEHFIENGGMIQFFLSINTIRFAVSPWAVEQRNLRLSSKLLRLAKIVTLK